MSKRIKIFVDAHCFDTEYQGTQTFVRELYTELCKHYADLDIYFGAYNAENIYTTFPFINPKNVLTYRIKKPSFFRLLFDIPAFINKHQFDFAHFQNIAPAKSATCKYIVTLHDVLFNDFKQDFPITYRHLRNLFFKRSIQQAHIKTTVSTYSLQRIHYHYKVSQNDITVIPNAVNKNIAAISTSAENYIYNKYGIKNFILCVGRMEPRKNQLLLLDTYLQLQLQQKDIALVFIGKPSINVPQFQKKLEAQNEKKASTIYWFHQMEEKDLYAFYCCCRLFVYPSKAEGFGMPPLEAAMCNAPVLCSYTSAMKDFSFFSPYTFNPANAKEFEEKLQHLINNPPSTNFLTAIATKIQQQYSWANSAEKLYQLIQQNAKP